MTARIKVIRSEYEENGYVVCDVADAEAFNRLKCRVIASVAKYLALTDNHELDLNLVHQKIAPEELNSCRLSVMQDVATASSVREDYYHIFRPYLEILVGSEMVMQNRLSLSVQMPSDRSSLLPIHADVWSGDSPYEIVAWLPLVNCFETKSMFIVPMKHYGVVEAAFRANPSISPSELFRSVEQYLDFVEINAGEVLLFNQNLPHGNVVNETSETRWSFNCRFKGAFTPYADKKLGEFFVPISLSPVSRQGLRFKAPGVEYGE